MLRNDMARRGGEERGERRGSRGFKMVMNEILVVINEINALNEIK